MLAQAHDELLFGVPREEVANVTPLIVRGMKEALPLRVPVLVEAGAGRSWAEAHQRGWQPAHR